MKKLVLMSAAFFVLLGIALVLIARYLPQAIGLGYSIVANIYALVLWSIFSAVVFVYQAVPKWAWVLACLCLAAYPLSQLTRRTQ